MVLAVETSERSRHQSHVKGSGRNEAVGSEAGGRAAAAEEGTVAGSPHAVV